MCSSGTRFSRYRIDACRGTNIGSDDVSAVVDAPGHRGSRAGVLDSGGDKRFCCGWPRCGYAYEKYCDGKRGKLWKTESDQTQKHCLLLQHSLGLVLLGGCAETPQIGAERPGRQFTQY